MKTFLKIIAGTVATMGVLLTSAAITKKTTHSSKGDSKHPQDEDKHLNLSDEKAYRKTIKEQLEANEQSIAEFNSRIAHQKNDAKAEYEQKIAALNHKNSDTRKKIEDFKADNEQAWEAFKIAFGQDMKALRTAFQDFTIKK